MTGRYFKCLTTLREHFLCMHAEKKHVCPKCGAKFGNPKRINLHMKSCQTFFSCSCGAPFKTKSSLLEHSMKNHHNLPDEIKNQLLGNANGSTKEGSLPRHISNLKMTLNYGIKVMNADQSSFSPMIVIPQTVPAGQQIKSNAYLIVGNPSLTLSKSSNGSIPLDSHTGPSGACKELPGSEAIEDVNAQNRKKSIDAVSKATNPADPEKLERLNRVLKQYKPIKKKTPFDSVVSDWQCIAPPRKYSKRRRRSGRRDERGLSFNQDDVSVTSMQHCLKNASNLVKSLLPTMQSPRRASSPSRVSSLDVEHDGASTNCVEEHREAQPGPQFSSQERIAKEGSETAFERKSSSVVANEEESSEILLRENISHHSRASLRELIMSSNTSKGFGQQQNFVPTIVANSNHHAVTADFNLENMTPEILEFLKASVDLSVQNRNINIPTTNDVSTQETQTPISTGQNQFSFDGSYPFLCQFDNNDIETQTESFSSFLSDAFTQTNQQSSTLFPNKKFVALNDRERLEASEGVNQLITDAFTQTRLGVDKSEASKAGPQNIADNHTQTNLSFDNFMKNFNFEAENNGLDSNLMPDFTDMCTQTNPDPRFDSRYDELLAPLTNGANPSNPSLNLSINSSQTQTVLSFDDMFRNSIGDDDVNFHGCRTNSTAYTQTSIIDDIFQTDSFTQTHFSV